MNTSGLENPQYYAERLRDYAKILQVGKFVNPPNILNDVAARIESNLLTARSLNESYERLVAFVWEESSNRPWEADVLNDADAMIKKGLPKIMDALALLRSAVQPQTTCDQIISLASSQQNKTLRMHLLCYVYLILVEGVYDEVLRFLYVHHLKLDTTNAEIKDIATRFAHDRVGESLLSGWNPTVRNAIGHATYYFDTEAEMIRFEDHRANKVEPLSFADFVGLVEKVVSVGPAVVVLLMLRVLVPLNFREVSRVLGIG